MRYIILLLLMTLSAFADPPTDSLVSWWRMDTNGMGTRIDSHSTNHLAGNSVKVGGGVISNGANFLSSNAWLSIPDNAGLSFGDEELTITCWARMDSTNFSKFVTGKWEALYSTNDEFVIYFNGTEQRWTFYVSSTGVGSGGTVTHVSANSFGAPAPKQWCFIWAEHDPVANTIRISVNDGTKDSVSWSGGIHNGTSAFTVGQFDLGDAYNIFLGEIDNVCLWRRKLSNAEITALYREGTNDLRSNFYVDYTTGVDTNAGTSRDAPWKRHPYMVGWAGTNNHVPGDRYLFKGGTTWPTTTLGMDLRAGGTTNTVMDYYGVDTTWYAGGSWSRPVFDGEGVELSTTYLTFIYFHTDYNPEWVVIDNIEFKGMYWTGTKFFGQVRYISTVAAHGVYILNCKFHQWSHGTYAAGTRDDLFLVHGTAAWSDKYASNCVFEGGVGNKSGNALTGIPIAINCTFSDVVNAHVTGGALTTIGCTIGPIVQSFEVDSGGVSHDNAIQALSANTIIIASNRIHDTVAVTIYVGGYSGQNVFIFDNVIWNDGTGGAIQIDGGGTCTIFNNTIKSTLPIRVVRDPVTWLTVMNNHYIQESGDSLFIEPLASVGALTNIFNTQQTAAVAASYGAVVGNYWRPTNGAPTINAGTNGVFGVLTTDFYGVERPQQTFFDIGAYEYTVDVPAVTNSRPAAVLSGRISASDRVTISR